MDFAIEPSTVARTYFETRFNLYTEGSEFDLCGDCDAKCCTDPKQVAVTAFDLIGIYLSTGKKPSEVLDYLQLASHRSLTSEYSRSGLCTVTLELEKPCNFLEGTDCDVHDEKPLACAVFPENHYKRSANDDDSMGDLGDYPCNVDDSLLSKKRTRSLSDLASMGIAETMTSGIYMFEAFPTLFKLSKYEGAINYFMEEYKVQNGITKNAFLGMIVPGDNRGRDIRQYAYTKVVQMIFSSKGFMPSIERSVAQLENPGVIDALVSFATEKALPAVLNGEIDFEHQYRIEGDELVKSTLNGVTS